MSNTPTSDKVTASAETNRTETSAKKPVAHIMSPTLQVAYSANRKADPAKHSRAFVAE